MSFTPREVTQLLQAWRDGDESALDRLMPMVYDELRRMARRFMRNERKGHTLQTSALINEAYLRLVEREGIDWQNRAHFFGVAAQAMRRVLVDYARARNYQKRAGKAQQVSLDEAANIAEERAAEIVALDDALESLARFDQRKCRVVELRYFGGLSVEETAEVLGVSVPTVMRDWNTAKVWLLREINQEASDDG
ncbi:MAG: sigma-70 family RNA polymerase sigma factor [Acidobacteria bacterium]|nr:sigma-70 family RNA polymerase sigma factor [Acidobacteriota bacterium]